MNASALPNQEPCCPFAESVRELCTGRLDDQRAAEVEAHLADCPSCGELVDTLIEPSDGIIQSLSSLPPSADDELEYRRLAARLLTSTPDGGEGSTAFVPLRLANPPIGPLPQTLGNYELLACVGRGAWGAVYRARHIKLDQVVAVKVLDSSRLQSTQAVDRFLQEMKAAGQLNHPNIVRATDAGEDRGFHYLVMEFVDGIDAGRLLSRVGPLAVADACEIVRQAAAALDFAHRSDWVHRDVKPSNLMLSRDGTVKLLDLGVAGRHAQGAAPNDPGPAEYLRDSPLGTADYMAPEQWANFATVDARADVYSLGCTLFKLLTGRVPRERRSVNFDDQTTNDPAPLVSTLRGDVPRGLDRIVARMLARLPEERLSSAAEVAEELARLARRADLPALVAGTCGTEPPPRGKLVQSAAVRGTGRLSSPVARRWVLAGAVAVACLALLDRWLMIPPTPQLRRDEWRDLEPVAPEMLLAVEPDAQLTRDSQKPPQITVRSNELALVHMGRSVAGVFSLEVVLKPDKSPVSAGVFFQGHYLENRPNVYEFQSLELRPPDVDRDPPVRRLLWSRWELVDDSGKLSAHRDPWAEAEIEWSSAPKGQTMQVTLGRRGFPEVSWNGRPIAEDRWELSTAGRRQASISAEQVQQQNLGRLGLINSGGTTIFLRPRLTYR